MSKQIIRSLMRTKSRQIGLSERIEEAHNIFKTIEIDQKFISSHCVALYVSLPDEVPTLNIIDRWYNMGKRLLLPRVVGDVMEFVEYQPNTLRKGAFGILEPVGCVVAAPDEIDLMIIPGVAFCSDGRRLGRGRGYYDKYLSQPQFRGYTIGVGFVHQMLDEIPCESHDIRLDRVVTPSFEIDGAAIEMLIVKIIDAAGAAATELGCGVEKLLSKGYTWVLSRLSIHVEQQPKSSSDIVIETWIEDCRRIVSTRNFLIKNSRGERIATASSQWCMIDMNCRKALDLTTAELDYTRHIAPRDISIERSQKISPLEMDGVISAHRTASELDIDFNNHVNTIRYIEMMLSMVDSKRSLDYAGCRIDLHFMSESLLGDRLTVNHKEQPMPGGTQLLFDIIRPDGSTSVRALFVYPR